jgi:hypothetical protein
MNKLLRYWAHSARRACTTLALTIIGLSPAIGWAQAPAPAEKTEIRSGEELRAEPGVDKSRAEVTKQLEQLLVQSSTKGQLLEELTKGHDGTAKSAIRIAAVDISLCRDEARALSILTTAMEDHRYQVWRLLGLKRSRLAKTQSEEARRTGEIERLAEEVASGNDEQQKPFSNEQLEAKKAVLVEKLRHRQDLTAYATRLTSDIEHYAGEMSAITSLDQRIDGMAGRISIHVERLIDAVRNEQEAVITGDLRLAQQDLRKVLDSLRISRGGAGKVPTTVNHPAEPNGVPLHQILDAAARPTLSVDEQQLLEAELAKARNKLKRPAP